MKIDGVICSLERVIYEYVGHLRARTPTINVSVATHDPFWFYSYVPRRDTDACFFEKSTIIKTLGVLPKKIYSARCLYDDMCANVLRSLRFMKSAHTRTARQRKKQMAYNSNSIR